MDSSVHAKSKPTRVCVTSTPARQRGRTMVASPQKPGDVLAQRFYHPPRLRPSRNGPAPPRMPRAAGRHSGPPAGQGPAGLHAAARRAPGHGRTTGQGARCALRQRAAGRLTPTGLPRAGPRHQHEPPHRDRRPARRRCGGARHRPGDTRRCAHRFLQRAPPRPPRRARRGHGVLLFQQRGRGHTPRAGRARPGARRPDRL